MNNQMLEQRLKSFTENFTKFRNEFHDIVNEVQNNDIIFAKSLLDNSEVERLNDEIERAEIEIELDNRKLQREGLEENARKRILDKINYNQFVVEEKRAQLVEIEREKKRRENENVERLRAYRSRLQQSIIDMKSSIGILPRRDSVGIENDILGSDFKEISVIDHIKGLIDNQIMDLQFSIIEKEKEKNGLLGKTAKEPVVKELQRMRAEQVRLRKLYNNLGHFMETLDKMESKYVNGKKFVDVFDLFDSTKGFDYLFEELADSLDKNISSTVSINIISLEDGSYSLDMRCGNKFAEPRPILGPNQLTRKNINELLLGFAGIVAQKSSFSDDMLINGNVILKVNGVELKTVPFGEVGKIIETEGLSVSEKMDVKKTDGEEMEIVVEQPTVEVEEPVQENNVEEIVEEQAVEVVQSLVEEPTVEQTVEEVPAEEIVEEQQVEEDIPQVEENVSEEQQVEEEIPQVEESVSEEQQVEEESLQVEESVSEEQQVESEQVVAVDVLPPANHEKRDKLFKVRSARKAKHWTAAAVMGVAAGVLIGGAPAIVGAAAMPLVYDKLVDLKAVLKNAAYTRKLKKLGNRIGFDYVADYENGTAYFVNKSNPNDILEQHELSSRVFLDEVTEKEVSVQEEINKIFDNKHRGVMNPQTVKEIRMAGFEKVTVENLHVGFQDVGGIRPLDVGSDLKWMFTGMNPKRYLETLFGKGSKKKDEEVVAEHVVAELEQPSEADILAAQGIDNDVEPTLTTEQASEVVAQAEMTVETPQEVEQPVQEVEQAVETAQTTEITDDEMEIVGNESILRDIAAHAGVQIEQAQDLTETETEGRKL